MSSWMHDLMKQTLKTFRGLVSYEPTQIPLLRRFLDVSSLALVMPPGARCEEMQLGSLPGLWIHPPEERHRAVIYFLHGGGFTVGSIATHKCLSAKIGTELGVRVFMLEYRKSPEFPFPIGLKDVMQGWEYVCAQSEEGNLPIVVGDSAGAGLAMSMMIELRDASREMPQLAWLMSPWVDLTFSGESASLFREDDPIVRPADLDAWIRLYAGDRSLNDPLISPLFGDLTGLPPMLIQASDREVLRDDAYRLADRLTETGVPAQLHIWEEALHVWQMQWHLLPEAQAAINAGKAFVRGRLWKQ
ncbi:alpha/beta hydrolase [Pontibacter sp. G13]|uniref:alpha/beta hydrolase n=1 Tax=Pontibacter sp. G13 TaxID=3074898 RepID=UPI00288A0D37|nr:alpha/beta hydrolase [Pontibacter sp. G13]WNJ17477.1 alpha/beta hydrolase [Pontibacter sp. G13]